jgi:hypothetical protein
MINELEEAAREDTQEDPSKRTDKGKSSRVSSAESQVTSHEIADRSDMGTKGSHETIKVQAVPLAITKVPYEHGKLKTRAIFGSSTTEVLPTTEPHNNVPATG